jgi:hypothetical protein
MERQTEQALLEFLTCEGAHVQERLLEKLPFLDDPYAAGELLDHEEPLSIPRRRRSP